MSALVHTAHYDAIDTSILQVECSFTRGFTGLHLIGNVSDGCRGGLERARTALESCGIEIPAKRIVINISPSEIKKDGSHLDLPIAVGLAKLLLLDSITVDTRDWLFAAELSIEGVLRPIRGAVSFAIAAQFANLKGIVVSRENEDEVAVLKELSPHKEGKKIKVLAFSSLRDVLTWLAKGKPEDKRISQDHKLKRRETAESYIPNFDDMFLTPSLSRVALVSAVGLHSILLRGAPGTGKTMFASRITSILPAMDAATHSETLKIYSSLYETVSVSLLRGHPPFRSPHHQASAPAILGSHEYPGEISLAHGGVLFLDEFPEYRRDVIESLREPLESGCVRVSRAQRKVVWNARVTLIAACNSCPCGWLGSHLRRCTCPSNKIIAYRRRISGPILDRIDMQVSLGDGGFSCSDIFIEQAEKKILSTKLLAETVLAARSFAEKRNSSLNIRYNRDLKASHINQASGLSSSKLKGLIEDYTPKHATRRSLLRSLRLARTLADIEQKEVVSGKHLKQAWVWLPSGDEISGEFSTSI